jgi:small subunit ribosomal protein S19e
MSKKIFENDPKKYNEALAEALKKIPKIEIPEWALYVKTGVSKQRPPEEEDFWYKRTASILRQLYINGVVGVEKLRNRYGSRKNRGVRRAKHKKASGKIIRVILQQTENAGLVEKVNKLQFGRRLTEKGREFLDSIKIEQGKDGKETQSKE